jgi:4a-hydroxytetrahydrobiopterin dehydratase
MSAELPQMKCVPCRGGERALKESEIEALRHQVPKWLLAEKDGVKRLERRFVFHDFAEAIAFTDRVGEIAEKEDHHPSITTEWGRVTITWWTHKIKGLHRNDFIMAAKTDGLYRELVASKQRR